MQKDKKEKRGKNPLIDFADSVNRSMVGDPGALVNGGCFTKIITLAIIVIGIFILSRCSY
ncbi:hypothetical protein [Lederbergia citrea]|uniref:hypothetical protein n=1 Tax=Lederbergia citrea TaxID=2833581 RepID=UPI001BCA5554|nr:hypothetical protein [Lederbergia citrea]MBS4176982.1 hypothetical protein [Lederbergia citrea]MBS4203556.1 hypothetical protein [Lederbergia citrea]